MAEVLTTAYKCGSGCEVKVYVENTTAKLAKVVVSGLPTGKHAGWVIDGVLKYVDGYAYDNQNVAGNLRESGAHMLAQTITPAVAKPIVTLMAPMRRVGSPDGNHWWELRTTSGGTPTSTILATSEAKEAGDLLTTVSPVVWDWPTPYTPDGSSVYALCYCGDFAINPSNYTCWMADGTSPAYGGGKFWTWNTTSGWIGYDAYDACFLLLSDEAGPTWEGEATENGTVNNSAAIYYSKTEESANDNVNVLIGLHKS